MIPAHYIALEHFTGRSTLSSSASALLKAVRQGLFQGKSWENITSKFRGRLASAGVVGEVLQHVHDVNLAWHLFSWAQHQKQYQPTLALYRSFLEALQRAGGGSFVQEKYDEMIAAGVGDDEYASCLALAGVCDAGDWRQPLRLINKRAEDNVVITANIFNVVIEGLCKMQRLALAEQMFCTMESMLPPNLRSYKILIKYLGGEYRISDAESYYDKLVEQKLEIDVATHELLVEIYCKVHEQDKAEEILKVMVEKGHTPGVQAYSAFMRCCLKNWNAQAGYQVFMKIEQLGYELTGCLYWEMVDGFWDSRMVDETRMLMKTMVSRGLTPSPAVFSNLITALACPGRIEEACKVFEEMLEAGYEAQADIYSLLISRLAKMSRAAEALELYEKMIAKHKPDQSTFQELVSCFCRANEETVAEKLYKQVVDEFKDMLPNLETYNCLLSHYCSYGPDNFWKSLNVEKALELLDEMVKGGRWPDIETFRIVIHGLCKGGRAMNAFELFLTIRDFDLVADAGICKTVIDGLCCIDRIVEAELVFDHLISNKRGQVKESRAAVSQVYKVIVEAKLKRKDNGTFGTMPSPISKQVTNRSTQEANSVCLGW